MSELGATPAEPTEIGFLLALKHCYVKGTTAQPKHTPRSRWLCSEAQLDALNMCASLPPPMMKHTLQLGGFAGISVNSCHLSCSLLHRMTSKGSLK